MERDFEVGGVKFRLNKINAIKQFHVARRVSPILSDVLPAMKAFKSANFEGLSEDDKLEQIAKVIGPFMKGLGTLPDAEAEIIFLGLLGAVERYQDQFKTWGRVANDKLIMFEDLELPTLLQAAGRAFMFNLESFFRGPLP